jgi:hypothetical protein
MDYWPLLDIRDAVNECDAALADVIVEVEHLQAESDGHYPPGAAELLANVEALQALLPAVFPAVLQEAIAAEQAGYDDAIDRWQPTQP